MGRELKRVPLKFDWPLNVIWKGYLNPYNSIDCKVCKETGYNDATRELQESWYSFGRQKYINVNSSRRYNDYAWSNHINDEEVKALVRGGRLQELMDGWYRFDDKKNKWFVLDRKADKWVVASEPKYPTAEAVNSWNRTSMGHDAINQMICVQTRARSLGVYGQCKMCKGHGYYFQSAAIKKLHDKWEPVDPPKGRGYQLWETTSEGSPQSPVFKSLEELCEHLEKRKSIVFR